MLRMPVICLGLAAAAAALLAVAGCAQTPNAIRGQSPSAEDGPLIGSAPGYGQHSPPIAKHHDYTVFRHHRDHNFGYEEAWYDGKEQYYPNQQTVVYDVGGPGDGCPACNAGQSCPPGGCPHCGFGCLKRSCLNKHPHGCPDNYATYSYKWPQNLVYPQPVVPAGMVQYPYYTLRGPTDFFMK
jgi:hypothetical protein